MASDNCSLVSAQFLYLLTTIFLRSSSISSSHLCHSQRQPVCHVMLNLLTPFENFFTELSLDILPTCPSIIIYCFLIWTEFLKNYRVLLIPCGCFFTASWTEARILQRIFLLIKGTYYLGCMISESLWWRVSCIACCDPDLSFFLHAVILGHHYSVLKFLTLLTTTLIWPFAFPGRG